MKIRFKSGQPTFRVLSMACMNFSAVFLGSMIIPVFVGPAIVDQIKPFVLLLGLMGTISSLFLSIVFAEKGRL